MRIFSRHSINLSKKIYAIILKQIMRGQILNGPYITEFEKKFAEYIGVRYAVGTSSGRLGLLLALEVLGLKKDDEIVVSDYNLHSIPHLIKSYGLKTIFIDIDSDTYNIDVSLIEQNITSKTKAILVTHLFGQPCQIDELVKIAHRYGLKIIEDCAQSCGAEYRGKKVGSFGDLALFSFNVGKNITCCGGGMLVTNDDALWKKICIFKDKYIEPRFMGVLGKAMNTLITSVLTSRSFFPYLLYPLLCFERRFGFDFLDHLTDEKITSDIKALPRYKARIANLQAVIGLAQLKSLDVFNEKTRKSGELLTQELNKIDGIKVSRVIQGAKPIYLYYKVESDNREKLRATLLKLGIDTKSDDMSACSYLSIFQEYQRDCPIALRAHTRSFEIPNPVYLNKEDIFYITKSMRHALDSLKSEKTDADRRGY